MPRSPAPLLLLTALIAACTPAAEAPPPDIDAMPVVPTRAQLDYQKMEFIGFVHFTVNTFTDREWGYGDESPALFAPTALDTDQWARVAAEVGMRELILTAKHHDGFTLWPSETTDHSVAASPWRGGEGDLVAEFTESARRHGVQVGLYVSPWDRNHPAYGTPAYLDAYRAQLRELLTGYGPVTELWVDGANGGDGYYGGAREERRIDRESYYGWPETFRLAKSFQPDLLIFSDAGPDIRWMGNEAGHAGETNWSTIDSDRVVIGAADTGYLNSGDPEGGDWVVPLCNTSIRPGWFWHADEDARVKSPQELIDLWYRSVGRNCVLLLNVPPDRRGLFHEEDVAALREFRAILDATFAEDRAAGRPASATEVRADHRYFEAARAVDGDPESYWAVEDETPTAVIEIELEPGTRLDRILLEEPIRFGQRIAAFAVDARVDGAWRPVAEATTVGYRRVLRIDPVTADGVRVRILESRGPPAISTVGVFLSDPREASPAG